MSLRGKYADIMCLRGKYADIMSLRGKYADIMSLRGKYADIMVWMVNMQISFMVWEVNMQISWGRHTFQITQPLTASLLGFVPTTITFSDTSLSILHTRDRREACISKMLYFVLPFRKRLFLGVDNCCVHETIQQTQQRYPQVLFLFLYFLSIFLFYIF